MDILPIIGSLSVTTIVLIVLGLLIVPLLRRRSTIDRVIEEEFKVSESTQVDDQVTLKIVFSHEALVRLARQATIYVQNVIDEAVEDGFRVAGTTVYPEVHVRFHEGDFTERAGTTWVGLLTHLDIKIETRVLGQRIAFSRPLRVRLEAPAYLDPGDEEEFHLNLDFKAIRVLAPRDWEPPADSDNELVRRITKPIDTALRSALSVGVLQRLDQVSILSLPHDLLGKNSLRIHPASIVVDEENRQVVFGLRTTLNVSRALPARPIPELREVDFAIIALPEILRALANAALADPDMRWTATGRPKKNGPLRLGIRSFDTSEERLKIALSLVNMRFPPARIDLITAVRTGPLTDLKVYAFVITSHPVLELITRNIDNLPLLRTPLSMALRRAFLLKPIALPEDRKLTVDIDSIYSSEDAVAASGRIDIRDANEPTFVQIE